MSDVMTYPTCGAVCRILGQDAEGLPHLRAFQNTDHAILFMRYTYSIRIAPRPKFIIHVSLV